MDRRTFLSMLGAGVVAADARAQQDQVHKIGALNFRSLRPVVVQILIGALRKQGYIQGQNLSIEFRFGEPEELPALAAELVRLDLKLITCGASAPLRALMAVTREIPVVAQDLETDPVAAGYASSLAHPGGNLTGLFLDLPEFSAKRLELLKETLPTIKRVTALWDPVLDKAPIASLQSAASALGVRVWLKPIDNKADLIDAFRFASGVKAGAIMVMQSPRLDSMRADIVKLGTQHRIPIAALFANFAEDGALLAYGPNVDEMTGRMGDFVNKIVRGSRPGDLPIQRPERFDLVVNTRTARRLGIAIPASIVARADSVIE